MTTVPCTLCQQAMSASHGAAGVCPACRTAMASSGKHWIVIRDDRRAGPITWAHLHDLAQRGQLRPDDVVMCYGAEAGLAARLVPQLNPQQQSLPKKPKPSRSQQSKHGRGVAILLGMIAGVGLAALLAFAIVGFFAYRAWSPADTGPRPLAVVKDETKKIPAPEKDDAANHEKTPPASDGTEKTSDQKKPPPEKKPDKKPAAAPDPNTARLLTETLVRQLNTYRKTAGLGLVQVEDELTRGCAAHAKYLALNPPTGPGDTAQLLEEDPGKPGFSEEGRRTAARAMVAIGDPGLAIDQWMGRLGGRLPLLHPDVRAVGVALDGEPAHLRHDRGGHARVGRMVPDIRGLSGLRRCPDLAGVVQPLQDRVDGRQLVRVNRQIDAHPLQTIAHVHRRQRQSGAAEREAARVGQAERDRRRQPEQPHQRADGLRELRQPIVDRRCHAAVARALRIP